jgi:sugar/nucleoside kinase (ribokinase family)
MKERLLIVGNLAKDVIDGEEKYGGSAANLAIAARGLGIQVGIMSVLGKDEFSARYREFLIQNDIDLSLTSDSVEQLPVCEVISRDNSISSSIWYDNQCHPTMDRMEVPNGLETDYDVAHLVSCPPGLARRLASLRVELSYEPGPMLIEDPRYFDKVVAGLSSFIFMNKEEHQAALAYLEDLTLSGDDYQKLLALIVTLGAEGSRIYQRNRGSVTILELPTIPVERVVDPTGAGDNFKAGFLVGYMRGRPIVECVQIGAEMGAACVMLKGGVLPKEVVVRIKDKYRL